MGLAQHSPLLEVVDLGKRFEERAGRGGALPVIAGMSFVVHEGEFVTLLGPSGSGKSTLLNIIAQIDGLTEGTIRFRGEQILGKDTSKLDPGWRCQIGYVTQSDNLLPWRRLQENLLLPLHAQGRTGPTALERVSELIEMMGLCGFERYYPHELSGGMRKRASLARTLVYDPPVILMDEPFGALDALTRAQLHDDLLRLWSSKRKTILFVTHDVAEAIALGDRLLVLSRLPARVVAEHVVDLPRPRRAGDLLTQPGFAQLYARIHESLG